MADAERLADLIKRYGPDAGPVPDPPKSNDVRFLLRALQDAGGALLTVQDAVQQTRDDFLHDPDHDNDTINWALGVIDAMPTIAFPPDERKEPTQ